MTIDVQRALGKLPPWHRHAACAKVYVPQPGGTLDPWYPSKSNSDELVAREVCSRCPVQGVCLEDALVTDDRFGMRGGLSPLERKNLRPRGRDPRT